ncbi:MAG: dihydroxyacetone kinase family protein [Nostocoides sp.]
MTHLVNDPETFAEEALSGFADLYRDVVAAVPGGVVRASETPAGKTAVVVGGGSGHYPAFCGVVGPGLADGAVVGNVFTSPSAHAAVSVGRAAENGGGVLFITGNYAGDVMNFDSAARVLRAEGVDARTVYVTDDVASADADHRDQRRGIAGDFVVFKIAGSAADAGLGLDEVHRLAVKANARTRTMGIGLGGCTMPGAAQPLFTVPPGRMGVGLGIHGEPGIADEPLPCADDVADLLLERVLAEEPVDSVRRVAAIVNGLGATKYEELFIVWGAVSRRLRARGFAIVEAEVGELVTSLDMGGISLTLTYLDEELERWWRAPAYTPAYRKSGRQATPQRPRQTGTRDAERFVPPATEAACSAGRLALVCLESMATYLDAAQADLGQLDAVAGDGDHGRGMVKGVKAAVAAATMATGHGAGIGSVLAWAGEAWAADAGGTSGVLWGRLLGAVGASLGDERGAITAEDVAQALGTGLAAVTETGGASVGDKTMVDALQPFVERVAAGAAAGESTADAWRAGVEIAQEAARRTSELTPRRGRARPLAERSRGHADPGATSLALCLAAVAPIIANGAR